jgi:hypothetical protein
MFHFGSSGMIFATVVIVLPMASHLEINAMKCEFLEGLASVMVSLLFCVVLIAPATMMGCAKEEKVLEVETPKTEVEVTRDTDTGKVDVEVDRDAAAEPAP